MHSNIKPECATKKYSISNSFNRRRYKELGLKEDIKMKHSKRSYISYSDVIRLAMLLLSFSNSSRSSLPKKIKILGVFEEGGDPAHEAGFKAAIDTINKNQDMNQDGHITLRGTEIVPQILRIRPGAR